MSVQWFWSGAITDTTAKVTAKVASEGGVTLDVDTSDDFINPTTFAETPDSDGLVTFPLSDLTASTAYHYRVVVEGADPAPGQFRTFDSTATSARIVVGSCRATVSDSPVWAAIAARDPDIFIEHGDLHYSNIAAADVAAYLAAYDNVHSTETWRAMTAVTPMAVILDDHDSGYNADDPASDRNNAGRAENLDTFSRCVPHYGLPTDSMGQAFDLGPCRVIMTDVRSNRSPYLNEPQAGRTMLGVEQLAWFETELLAARDAGRLAVWVSPTSWYADASDGWRLYTHERDHIAAFVAHHQVPILILSGDIHACSLDDGTNTPGGIPEFTAAPLHRYASVQTDIGPWSHGSLLTNGIAPSDPDDTVSSYGLVDLVVDGDNITVECRAVNVDLESGEETEMAMMPLSFPIPFLSQSPGFGWWMGALNA